MKIVHDWLKAYLGEDIPSAEKIEELLTFHAFEIEGRESVGPHEVIDVDILPNRSSDCLCHRGVAREIATLTGETMKNDPLRRDAALEPKNEKLAVTIEDNTACRRFGAALVTGVKVGPSPKWLQERLEATGQRSINNVVDITNYIMLSLGQPLHAYDGEKFPQKNGVWQLGVRFAKDGEKVTVLGGDEYTLDKSVQVIVEGIEDTAIGIAGIKGGQTAEVDEATTTVIFEAANFEPTITRKAAQKIKLQTDASKRFENEISREVIPFALQEAVRLLEELGGGTCEGYLDEYPTHIENTFVDVSLIRINALLGLSLEASKVENIFTRLGFKFETGGDSWSVQAPFERTDINIEEDVIEEIGRVHGYEHVDSVIPEGVNLTEYNPRQFYGERVRKTLVRLGFSEVITSSFRKKDEIHLLNALASDKGCLRSDLTKNITEVLERNAGFADLLGTEGTRVFEIGTVFHKGEKSVKEHVSLCLGVRTKQSGHTKKDDEILEEVIGELTITLDTNLSFEIKEGVAELNFSELIASLPAPATYDPIESTKDVQYKPFSLYQHMSRDIALWVSEGTDAVDVEAVLNEHAGDLRVRTTLFDEFSKDGRTSYAFRLVFQSNEKTLTDSEVNAIMDDINAAVAGRGWEVR